MNAVLVILHMCLTADGPCRTQHYSTLGECYATGAEWLDRAEAWANRSRITDPNLRPHFSCSLCQSNRSLYARQ